MKYDVTLISAGIVCGIGRFVVFKRSRSLYVIYLLLTKLTLILIMLAMWSFQSYFWLPLKSPNCLSVSRRCPRHHFESLRAINHFHIFFAGDKFQLLGSAGRIEIFPSDDVAVGGHIANVLQANEMRCTENARRRNRIIQNIHRNSSYRRRPAQAYVYPKLTAHKHKQEEYKCVRRR